MSVGAIQRCSLFTEASPERQQAHEVAVAIESGPWSFCNSERESQAVLLGLVAQRRQRPASESSEMAVFLRGLHTHDCWAPGLAPAVYYGLRHTDGQNIVAWLNSLDEASRQALGVGPNSVEVVPGTFRHQALTDSRKFFDLYGAAPGLGVGNGTRLGMLAQIFAGSGAEAVT